MSDNAILDIAKRHLEMADLYISVLEDRGWQVHFVTDPPFTGRIKRPLQDSVRVDKVMKL